MRLQKWRTVFLTLFAVMLLSLLPQAAFAEDARDIRKDCQIEVRGVRSFTSLMDSIDRKGQAYPSGFGLTVYSDEHIGSLYLIFDKPYGSYTVTNNDTGEQVKFGLHGVIHELIDLEASFGRSPASVSVDFDNGKLFLNEIYIFSPGELPSWVQQWETPEDERADLVLFSTHCDDEQLFFAGALPYYAAERNYRVQVVYLTDHRNLTNVRVHEALNGLWAVGVRRYPVFGEFGDYYAKNKQDGYNLFGYMKISDDDLLGFTVEQMRRFKPLVALGHDPDGEYGHGQHMVFSDLVQRASAISGDETKFPELAEKYGVWDVPKVYLHLYPEGQIVMDWDQPLASFGGKTAYEMCRDYGFPAHASQYTNFSWYMHGAEKAADITEYSPCEYGLFRTTVGPDTAKNDFFENLVNYDEQIRQAEEAAAWAEEQARLEALAAEDAVRAKEAEAAARKLAMQEAQEARKQEAAVGRTQVFQFIAGGIAALLAISTLAAWLERKKV